MSRIKIVDKLDLPVGKFVSAVPVGLRRQRGNERETQDARCSILYRRREIRGNVVEFQAAPTASRINFRANRIDSGPLAICLDRDKRRSSYPRGGAARRGATPTTTLSIFAPRGRPLLIYVRAFLFRYIEIAASLLELRFPLCNHTKIPFRATHFRRAGIKKG